MRTHLPLAIACAVLFLFFIQLGGTLVESIYILDLLNTALDEKVLGLLFFFSPALLLFLRRAAPGWLVGLIFSILLVARGLTPYLGTSGRLLASGIGTAAALLLLPLLFAARPRSEHRLEAGDQPIAGLTPATGLVPAAGLALAVGLSVTLRTMNHSLDLSLTPGGGWLGWGLGLLLGLALLRLEWRSSAHKKSPSPPPTLAWVGVFLALTLVYFAFAAPAVIARWTAGSYPAIVLAVSLLALGWAGVAFYRPGWLERIPRPVLVAWNMLLALALTGTLLAHRVPFPLTPESPAAVIGPPTWLQQIPLALTLLLYPVVFVDLARFARRIRAAGSAPRIHVPGLLLGALALVLLAFMVIFTNVWAYVEPVSPFFRNKFWLPFALLGGGLTLLSLRRDPLRAPTVPGLGGAAVWGWLGLLAALFGLIAFGALRSERIAAGPSPREDALLVMTYNIQQANDGFGEQAYDRQLALIQQVNPDVLALQESDSARIGLNNNDYVRYYASRLGYYSYYGPSTVAGTYGTALLSRYPLRNPRTVYSFSDRDEIGTAEAEIEFGGRIFTIYNVHPAGSDTAMGVFAQTLLARAGSQANVVALGDYNLRESAAAYQAIAAQYTNAWLSVYPDGISPDGVDMSGDRRIDHIFISPHLRALEAVYLLPPESATDHPAHWAVIGWGE